MSRQLIATLSEHGLEARFVVARELGEIPRIPLDSIACLGVLEHMSLRERETFYSLVNDLLAPSGQVMIDVPVEVGPTLLVKNLVRRRLKGRPREYGWRELLRLSLGGTAFDSGRFDPSDSRTWIHDHRGFDTVAKRRRRHDGAPGR